MVKYTTATGALLILLGVGFYFGLASSSDGAPSATALIPAFAGLPILFAGLAALREPFRKHAMHVASLLALIGFVLPAGRLAMLLGTGAELKPAGTTSLVLMAFLCGSLLAACIKSFINTRRASAA